MKKKVFSHKSSDKGHSKSSEIQVQTQEQNLLHLSMAHHQQRVLVMSRDYHLLEDDEQTDSGSDQESYEEDINEFAKYKELPKTPVEEKCVKDPYIESALAFFTKVKQTFAGEPEKVDEFFRTLKSISSDNCDLLDVLTRLKVLIRGHPDLLAGINSCIPPSLKIHPHELQVIEPPFFPFMPQNSFADTESDEDSKKHLSSADISLSSLTDSNKSFETPESTPNFKRKLEPDSEGESATEPEKKVTRPSYIDPSIAQVGQYATYSEMKFFDKVRKALGSQSVYENFLKIIELFNKEVITHSELYKNVKKILGNYPELCYTLKTFLNVSDEEMDEEEEDIITYRASLRQKELLSSAEYSHEIDYTTCKKKGASYRMLPKNYPQPVCSGRTQLCKEVLNDTYVSFPSWSEDPSNSFVTSQKTFSEEQMYRCEDERFELDHAISGCKDTLNHVENLQLQIDGMPPDEKAKFTLDDNLNSSSNVLHWITIKRLYGDKAEDLFQGLKDNPVIAVPIIIRRLKAKEEEWKTAQTRYNLHWDNIIDLYYLRSLDLQGTHFRRNDSTRLRSKALLNEIYTIADEQQQASELGPPQYGPHMTLDFRQKADVFEDIVCLLFYHINNHNSLSKQDKRKMGELLLKILPDFLDLPHLELASTASEEDITEPPPSEGNDSAGEDDDSNADSESVSKGSSSGGGTTIAPESEDLPPVTRSRARDNVQPKIVEVEPLEDIVTPTLPPVSFITTPSPPAGGKYKMFYCSDTWYLIFRLLHFLVERLSYLKHHAQLLAEEEGQVSNQDTRNNLQLSDSDLFPPEDYYHTMLTYVCCMLDGMYEPVTFEDKLRQVLKIHAYKAYTMDRLIQNLTRQLQKICGEEEPCYDLYKAMEPHFTEEPLSLELENLYRRRMEQKLGPEENCVKIIYFNGALSITLLERLDIEGEDPESTQVWSEYVDSYVSPSSCPSSPIQIPDRMPVFLKRNLRSGKKRSNKQDIEEDPCLRIWDRQEVHFPPLGFHLSFVQGAPFILYWACSLTLAHKSHKHISECKSARFSSWLQNWWLENHISSEQHRICRAWFLGRGAECHTESSPSRPPYFPYTRYCLPSHHHQLHQSPPSIL